MNLNTRVLKNEGDPAVLVLWATGKKTQGILRVHADEALDDVAIMAELVAIRHLLFKKKVHCDAPTKGSSVFLEVSKGAIKKLVLGSSSKKHLQPYASFLRARLEGVNVTVSHDLTLFQDYETLDVEDLYVTEEHREVHDRIETPSMGIVYLTKHAVDMYIERSVSGAMKSPWGSIIRRLQNPSLCQVPLPPRVLKHKEKRYGTASNVEAWKAGSDLTFIVLSENGRRTVVTVFSEVNAKRISEDVYHGSH